MSIRTKLMALLLAATMIPIVLSMVISDFYIKNQVTDKAIRENQSLLSVGKINLLNYMDSISGDSLTVYHAINSPTSLYSLIERASNPQTDIAELDRSSRTLIYQHLLNLYQSSKEIHQLHLQFGRPDDSWSYLLTRRFFRSGQEDDGGWPKDKLNNPTPFIEPTHINTHYELDWSRSVSEEEVITFRRPIIRTPSDQVIGYLSLDIRTTELVRSCGQLKQSDQEKLYLLDRQGRVICGSDSSEYGHPLDKKWVHKLTASSSANGFFKWSDDAFAGYMVYDTLKTPYMDWIVVKQLPYSYLYANAKGIRNINSLIIALSLAVAVIATLLVSVRFTNPIKRLIGRINQVQTGNLSLDDPVRQGSDEFSVLTRRFNSMIATIDDLINREYKLEIANKTNQLKAMQAQINPHFLNNALQSIGTLALQSGAPKVYTLIAAMAKMMRYNMNTEETVVPLQDEVAHARAYLDLQRQRFDERLEIEFEIAPETTSVHVPKMLLQPLIENYFQHGYESRGEGGSIAIRSSLTEAEDGRYLIIAVIDNGAGMESGDLASLQQRLARGAAPASDKHIGLSNVSMRLKLYYGEQAALSVDSAGKGGFRVTLQIPLHTDLKEETNS